MKVLLFLAVLMGFTMQAQSASWDETINSILNNMDTLAKKNPNKPAIGKSLILTKRLLKTHENSYLKFEIEKQNKRKISQEIYYSKKDFLVTVYESESNLKEYNLYHKDGWIYQWDTNSKTGVKYQTTAKELVFYVGYSINPLGLVSTFYEDYLEFPETFEIEKNENEVWTELKFTVRRFTYKSLLVELDNVWFHGFRTFDPETKEISTNWMNPPQSYTSLPANKIAEYNQVVFTQDNSKSLKQFMRYISVVPGNAPE